MNNFGGYITVDKIIQDKMITPMPSKEELIDMSHKEGVCINCDEEIWKLGACGLCFSCTTGESDASDDLELLPFNSEDVLKVER